MVDRYAQLLDLIDEYRPRSLIEVGTWNGNRAGLMIQEAAEHSLFISYLGFDLFEDASGLTDAAESNVKKHFSVAEVTARLAQYSEPPFNASIRLIRGNTRETLHGKSFAADFVFLDGGHSIETIAGDYAALKGSKIIVLDDFYTEDERGGGIDIGRFGCNQLLAGIPHRLLPQHDPVRGGGYVQMAVIDA